MQARVKSRVEDLLHNICEGLRRNLPTGQIIGPDNYRCSLEKVKQRLPYLTPQEREAVIMARRGHTHAEIAVQLNINVESVKAHLRRGYLTLITSASETGQE